MQPATSPQPLAQPAPPLIDEPSTWASASSIALDCLLRIASIARTRREKGTPEDEEISPKN